MKIKFPRMTIIATSLMLSACATNHMKYDWGSYDTSLHTYYNDPAKVAVFSLSLKNTIDDSNARHMIVAPGIYAEYGYMLLQQGKSQAAVAAFEEEEKHWPESKAFMDRLIQVASSSEKKSENGN